MLDGKKVIVVGAGFGGISTACYLADRGADVRILEKNEQVGGRASVLEKDGFRFDMGPSWYLMPDVYERFFENFGKSPEDYYELEHLDPHYRIFFKDGDKIDISGDKERVKQIFEDYEEGAGDAFEKYLEKSKKNYEVGMEEFVYKDRSSITDFISWSVFKNARAISLLGNMESHVSKYFDNPKLKQVMQYSLVFLGGSPKNTPALYNLMSHVDFNLGVWYPENGMKGVVDGMVELAEELGVEIEVNSEVTEIDKEGNRFEIETVDGSYESDIVVSNADYAHTEQSLLDEDQRQYTEKYWDERTYAPSAYLLYLGVEGDIEELEHHTLVLPLEWEEHFEQIFDEPDWPEDPAYYICAPSKTDDSVAPEGHSNLFVLVPIAPGLEDSEDMRENYRDKILEDIAENTGVDLRDRIVFEKSFCVDDFKERYNSKKGTALGLAHTLKQTSFMRPSHRSSEVDGLYFVGANTTPGIGVPMCLISGEITADVIEEDYTKKKGLIKR